MLADVIRARADFHSLDPVRAALTASLEALADYVEAHAPGSSPQSLSTLETQARRYEVVFGFPDLGERASAALDVAVSDHAEKLREVAAASLLDAYEELRANTLSLPRSYETLNEFAVGYGLRPWEVEAALDGIELHTDYFSGSRSTAELKAARATMPAPEVKVEVEQRPLVSARRQPRRSGRRRGRR